MQLKHPFLKIGLYPEQPDIEAPPIPKLHFGKVFLNSALVSIIQFKIKSLAGGCKQGKPQSRDRRRESRLNSPPPWGGRWKVYL